MTKKLQEKIDAFLTTKRKTSGGYAPVTGKDLDQLLGIIQYLFEAKWERDPDGDLPLEFKLIDRTRFEPMHFMPVPYMGLKSSPEQMEAALEMHIFNLNIAHERFSGAYRILEHERKRHPCRQECVCAETSSRNCPVHGR